MEALKIYIDDGMQIELGTGIGKYSLNLYNAMKEIGIDVTLADGYERTGNKTRDRINYLRYINSKEFQKHIEKYDVVLFTNYAIPYRRNKKIKYIATIHDMCAFLFPKTLPVFYRYYNQIMIKHSAKMADLILTVSNSVASEISAKFPANKNKIRAIWVGVNDGISPKEKYLPYENKKISNIDDYPFFLFVSTVEKRKNVGFVIDAFLKFKKENENALDYKLVIAGRPGYGYEEFLNQVENSTCKDDIIFTGYICDNDCNRLYNHATAFIFPTVYEGFGSAQVECMKCHLPILLSDIPTNREISRDYGEFFNLNDVNTLVEKMKLFLNDQYDYSKKEKGEL